jgi:hypothetical protein
LSWVVLDQQEGVAFAKHGDSYQLYSAPTWHRWLPTWGDWYLWKAQAVSGALKGVEGRSP